MKLIRISAVWCSSCIVTQASWKQIQQEYPDITFEQLDYDMDEELVKKYQVEKILPVIIIENEKNIEVARIVGEKSKKEIVEKIEQFRGDV